MNKRGTYFTVLALAVAGIAFCLRSPLLGGLGLYYFTRYLYLSHASFWRKDWHYLIPGMIAASGALMGLFSCLRSFILQLHSGETSQGSLHVVLVCAALLVLVEAGYLIFPRKKNRNEKQGQKVRRIVFSVADRLAYLFPLAVGTFGLFQDRVSFWGLYALAVLLFLYSGISEILRCAVVVNRYLSSFKVLSS